MKGMNIRIEKLSIVDAPVVFDWVMRLLAELGEEGEELGELNKDEVLLTWKRRPGQYHVLVAKNSSGEILGILTLSVAFAIYANGEYGIIDEMYVAPDHRSEGIGARLVEAARDIGKEQGWRRIDVTAPESERWERTRKFYEKLGFVFTGPKLKLLL
jgi:GNAT superfamily N-acetyltransferase